MGLLEFLCAVDWAQFWGFLSAFSVAVAGLMALKHQAYANTYASSFADWQRRRKEWEDATGEMFFVHARYEPKVIPRYVPTPVKIGGRPNPPPERKPDWQSITIMREFAGSISVPTNERFAVPGKRRRVRVYASEDFGLPPILDYREKTLRKADLGAANIGLHQEALKNRDEKMEEGPAGELWLDLVLFGGDLLLKWRHGRRWRAYETWAFGIGVVAGAFALAIILYRGFSLPCF